MSRQQASSRFIARRHFPSERNADTVSSFKDVMASMGLVEVSLIGHEASGIVVAIGSNAVERFQLGDRVVVSGE